MGMVHPHRYGRTMVFGAMARCIVAAALVNCVQNFEGNLCVLR